jgi:hypothetical protein
MLPAGARRHFAHLPAVVPDAERHSMEVIERLLENGDRRDLAWLVGNVSEDQLAAWMRERGARRLSDRSRAFWSLVLDLPLEPRPDAAKELWPL